MHDPLDAVSELLARAKRPGDFYTRGEVPAAPPLIEVEGVGPLAFLVLDHQAWTQEVAGVGRRHRHRLDIATHTIRVLCRVEQRAHDLEHRGRLGAATSDSN